MLIAVDSCSEQVMLWQDQASKDRALQALSSMSSAQIVSATALQPAPGTGTGRSVLPSVLYPHVSPLGMHYPAYGSSGVGQSAQVMVQCACTGGDLAGHSFLYGLYASCWVCLHAGEYRSTNSFWIYLTVSKIQVLLIGRIRPMYCKIRIVMT